MVLMAMSAMLISCSDGGSNQSDNNYSQRIYMLSSKNGRLTPIQTGNISPDPKITSWTLTLENLEPAALWYADRPGREAGSTPLKDYVNSVWPQVYGLIDPNATVVFQLPGSSGINAVYMNLSSPAYDEKSKAMSFRAEIRDFSGDLAPSAALNLVGVTVNVLNNATDNKEVVSYIQYASQATLQPTEVANQFQVVLSNAGPDMFWVDNAPGRYWDNRLMSYFFPQWPYLFNNNPPNAALFGKTAAGDLKMYFMTLTNPVHDAALGQVRYTATLLGQTSGPVVPVNDVILSIDSAGFSRFPLPGKGTAYAGFGAGYDPSTANSSYIYFGSDAARSQMGSLWGTKSYLSQSCAPYCRDDLKTMKDMGINLIRLYDWDKRNDHSQFLDYANSLDIKVVVPISNFLPENPQYWDEQVPDYFKYGNFGNKAGTDWHPAVAGVIISNELDGNGDAYGKAVGLVARFLQEADKRGFSKNLLVGIPVTFVPRGTPYASGGQNMPGWNQFNQLLTDPRTAPYKDRLMLCPNTYNSRQYLFANAEGTGKGWVELTYQKFGVPILFTEIGYSRAKPDYTPDYVKNQLQGALEYQKSYPNQLLGAMHFQFDNKVWKQTLNDSDSEGAFGTFSHGKVLKQIQTVAEDYDFYVNEVPGGVRGVLTIDQLDKTNTYNPVVEAYK